MSHHTTEAWLRSNPGLAGLLAKDTQAPKTEPNAQPLPKTEEEPSVGTSHKSRWLTDPEPSKSQQINNSIIDSADTQIDTRGSWGKYLQGINPRLLDVYREPADDVNIPMSAYEPNTEELEALDAVGLLFDPSNGMPKYALTKDFRQKMARKNAPLKALGLSADVVFGGIEQIAEQARFGGEYALTIGGKAYSKEEQIAFQEARTLKEAELGRSLDPYEFRTLFDESFDVPGIDVPVIGEVNPRNVSELALELALPATTIDKAFDLAIKPAFKGLKFMAGDLRAGLRKTEVPGAVEDVAQIINPPQNNVFNLPEVKVTLVEQEKVLQSVRDMWGAENSIYDDLVENLKTVRQQTTAVSDNLANSMSAELDYTVKQAFDIQPNGQIPKLPHVDGTSPTISDIAANYKFYEKHLSSSQKEAMIEIRTRLAPIKKTLDDLGIELGQRFDIKKGGFYIPRGQAFTQAEIAGEAVISGNQKSFKQTASYTSEAKGIQKGLTYTPFKDSVDLYIKTSGKNVGDTYTAKVLKEAKDADGNLIGSTYAQRLAGNSVYVKGRQLRATLKEKRKQFTNAHLKSKTIKREADRAAKRAEDSAEAAYKEIERVSDQTKLGPEVQKAESRAFNAKGRFDGFAGKFNVGDLKLARSSARAVVRDVKELTQKIQKNHEQLKVFQSKASRADKELLAESAEATELLDTVDRLITSNDGSKIISEEGDLGTAYDNILNATDDLSDRYDALIERSNALDIKIDELIDKEDLLKGMDRIVVARNREAREQVRILEQAQIQEKRLKNEFKLAEKELSRITRLNNKVTDADIARIQKGVENIHGQAAKIDRNATKALVDQHNAREAFKEVRDEYAEIAGEMRRIKAVEAGSPRGMRKVNEMPQLHGTDYPAELAQQINKIIRDEGPLTGPGSSVIKAFQWHSGLWRSLRATLDDSAPMIHGLLRLFDNPVMAGKAFAWHWRAWGAGGDELLGKYIKKFNSEAKAKGMLSTDQWSALGVRIGGADTEFTIGKQKFTRQLQKVPGIQQANRAFGYYGDRLRMDWANDLLGDYLQQGRTLDEIMNGDLGKEIADAVNTATGYANKRFGGEYGDMLTFAPRFFQARLNNIARATKGTIKDPLGAVLDTVPVLGQNPGKGFGKLTPQERVARRSMMRLISQGTLLTVGMNAALGNETDFDILKKNNKGEWVYNSNFMRIRFADRDWSIFGTYDSMLRLMIMSGIGVGTMNPGNFMQGLRGIASGPVSLGWDLVSGETFDGTQPKAGWMPDDPEFLPGDDVLQRVGFIAESHLPFAADQLPEVGEKIGQGDVKGAISMAAGEFMGIKSAPMSYKDLVGIISKEKIEQGISSPTVTVEGTGWDAENLSDGELDIIKQDPRMKDMLEEFKAKNKDELGLAFERLEDNFVNAENELAKAITTNAQGQRLATLIRELKRNRSEAYKDFERQNMEALEEIDTKEEDLNRADYWAQKYFNVEMQVYSDSGYMDFDAYERERNKILEQASKENPAYSEYISGRGLGTFRGERFGDENVRALIDEYDNDVMKMRDYWDVSKRVAQYYGYEKEYEEYLKSPNKSEYKKKNENGKLIKALEKKASQQKIALRMANPELEALLYKWGSITEPKNPIVLGMRQQLRNQSPTGEADTMDIQKLIEEVFGNGNN